MFNEYSKLLNSSETLRNNIQIFIDAFVEFYGEDKRAEIEDKFQRTLLITYKSPDSLNRILYTLKKLKSENLSNKLLKDIETIYTLDDLLKDFLYDSSNLMPISNLKKFFELYKLSKEERLDRFLNKGVEYLKESLPDLSKEDLLYIINNHELPERYSNIPGWLKNNISYYTNPENAEIEYKKIYKKIEHILKKANPQITLENFSYYLDEKEIKNLFLIIQKFDSQLENYNDFESSISEYIEMNKKRKKIYGDLSTKYYKEYIRENLDLIPEDKRKNVEKYLNDENEIFLHNQYISNILGYSLKGLSILDSFSSKADQTLEENKNFWKVEQIKRDRINYFNQNGINMEGAVYEDYLNNPEVQKICPSKDRINKFFETKNNLINKFNIEYYESLESHKKLREEIDSYNLLNKDDMFDVTIYEKEGTFATPNIRKVESTYELVPVVAIFCGNQNDYLDAGIVHELNHVYEMVLLEANDKEYTTSCGWEKFTDSIITEKESEVNTLETDREIRPYELFNEIINELIAQEISEIMAKKNKHVFNSEYTAKIKHGTSYEHTFFLVKGFYAEYKDKIIESRKNGNIEIIWNEVGKENFDELNSLFAIFYEHFSGMKIYSVLTDLKNNVDNEKTRIYKNLIIRSNEILEKMKNYNSLNNNEEKNNQNK